MITIVDYGIGNINAFLNIFNELGIQCKLASSSEQLNNVSKLILPGVGHFDFAMQKLNNSGMVEKLNTLVLVEKIPVLGICVGMQMMANESDEGTLKGLGWIDAKVKKITFSTNEVNTILPHMGWNTITVLNNNKIVQDFNKTEDFYFLHSYYMHCTNTENVIAHSFYGIEFACLVQNENIYGIQCHPEKSHQIGIKLLNNFANL